MDVLRTDDERENAEKRGMGDLDAGRATSDLDPKDYTVTEIQAMDLTREQLQALLDQENASEKPRVSLVEWLEGQLGEGQS